MSYEAMGTSGGQGELDLPGVGRALWARKGWVISATALCLAASLMFVSLAKSRYTGESKIFVDTEENFLNRTGSPDRTQSAESEAMGSHVAIAMSRDIAREAIRKLGLTGNSYFDPLVGGSGLSGFFPSDQSGGAESSPEDRMFENYFENLLVFSLPKSRVLQIEFSAPNPELAARGANLIADLYIESQSNAKRRNARAASQALAQLVPELRQKLAAAEEAAEKFRSASGLLPGSALTSLQGQQLTEVSGQMAAGRAAQAEAQAKARLLREALRTGRLNEVPDVAKDDLIRRVSEQRIALRSQLALESRTLGPEHPRTKDMVAQLGALEGELRGLLEKTARTLENDARLAGAKVENLLQAIEQQKKIVGGSGADEVRMRELDRDVRLIKEQLEATTARWQDATAREEASATPGEARVISRAVPPKKATFPKKGPIIALSTIAGLVFSIFAVVAIELFSGRAYGAPTDLPPTSVNVGPRRSGGRPAGEPGRGGGGPRPGLRATGRMGSEGSGDDDVHGGEQTSPMRRFGQLRASAAQEDAAYQPDPALAPPPQASAPPQSQASVPGLTDAQMEAIRALAAQVLSGHARTPLPEAIDAAQCAPIQALPAQVAPPPPSSVQAPVVQHAPAMQQPPAQSFEEPMAVARPLRSMEMQVSAAYRDLAQQIREQSEEGTAALVLVSGVGPDLAGQAALPLARALASGSQAILVDFTGRASPLNRRVGLSELIFGDASFAQAIHRDPGSRLHLLNRGRADVNLTEGLETVIEALSQTYDFVVFVGPGAEDFDLTMWLAPAMDYSFIARRGNGESAEGVELQEALEQEGAPDVSVLDVSAMSGQRSRGRAQNAA